MSGDRWTGAGTGQLFGMHSISAHQWSHPPPTRSCSLRAWASLSISTPFSSGVSWTILEETPILEAGGGGDGGVGLANCPPTPLSRALWASRHLMLDTF